jgi:hypothetical protein
MKAAKIISHVPIVGVLTPDGWKRAQTKRAARRVEGRRSFIGGALTLPFRVALWIVAWPIALIRSRNRRHRIETSRIISAIEKDRA